jgi:hypothetical protein
MSITPDPRRASPPDVVRDAPETAGRHHATPPPDGVRGISRRLVAIVGAAAITAVVLVILTSLL